MPRRRAHLPSEPGQEDTRVWLLYGELLSQVTPDCKAHLCEPGPTPSPAIQAASGTLKVGAPEPLLTVVWICPCPHFSNDTGCLEADCLGLHSRPAPDPDGSVSWLFRGPWSSQCWGQIHSPDCPSFLIKSTTDPRAPPIEPFSPHRAPSVVRMVGLAYLPVAAMLWLLGELPKQKTSILVVVLSLGLRPCPALCFNREDQSQVS